jgi:predicted XRE-type DNA-binding protein
LIIYALRFTNTLYSDRDRIMKNNDILIEQTSDNVFADLGYANAEEALLKSNFAQAIIEVIEQQKLSEVDVFTRLGINSL